MTSGIGGAVFIVGFLLSSILQDYKEAEKIPADLRNSIEAIDGDLACFAQTNDAFDLRKARQVLLAADSDRCRPGFRDDLAHHSDLKSPTRSEMMSPTIPG